MSKTYKTENRYFNTPAQVRWRVDAETMKEDNGEWFSGIAYRDELICGCCDGSVIVTKTEEAKEIQVTPWLNIADENCENDRDVDLDPE